MKLSYTVNICDGHGLETEIVNFMVKILLSLPIPSSRFWRCLVNNDINVWLINTSYARSATALKGCADKERLC